MTSFPTPGKTTIKSLLPARTLLWEGSCTVVFYNISHPPRKGHMTIPQLATELRSKDSPQALRLLTHPGARTLGIPHRSTTRVGCTPVSAMDVTPLSQVQRHCLRHLRVHNERTVQKLAPVFSFPSQWLVFTHPEKASRGNYPRDYPPPLPLKAGPTGGINQMFTGIVYPVPTLGHT